MSGVSPQAEALVRATSDTVWDVLARADEYTVGLRDHRYQGEVQDRAILRMKVRAHGNMTHPFLVRLT